MAEMTPGQICRARREELGLTREAVAAQAGISHSTVTRLELNNRIPNGRTLVRITRALGISVEQLFPVEANGAAA